jgi:hypothetical protein
VFLPALLALAAAPGAASAATQQITYSPFNAAGKVAVPTRHARSGGCFAASLKAARPDALRCFRGHTILDPCFKVPHSKHVVICVYQPSSVAARLKVPRIPKKRNRNLHNTWALTVAVGECPLIAGATNVSPYGRLNYACPGRLYLFGDPIPQNGDWMIWAGHDPGAADAQLIPISIVWY